MKKITILLIVLVLSLTFVEAQFVSPGRNVAERKKAEAVAIHRPTQSASAMYVQRYRSEQERIKATRSIARNNIVSSIGSERRETVTRSIEKVSGIGVVTARTGEVRWNPRQTLPSPPSHRSTLFKRARASTSSY